MSTGYFQEEIIYGEYNFDYTNSGEQINEQMSDYCQQSDSRPCHYVNNIRNSKNMHSTFDHPVNEKGDQHLQQPTYQSQNMIHSELIKPVENQMRSFETFHANLLAEAANLRQWKQEKEHETRRMEFTLKQMEEVIKNLRMNLMEVKLENEKMSQKLADDNGFYEEKLEVVYQLMTEAKNNFSAIDGHIQTFQNMKSTLETVTEKRRITLQSIYEKINEYYDLTEDKIAKMIEFRQQEVQSTESHYNNELRKAEEHLMKLTEVLEEQGRMEEQLQTECKNLLERIETYETEKQGFVSELDKLKLEQLENKALIESLELTRKNLKDTQMELEDKLSNAEKEIREKDDNAVVSKDIITTLQNKVYNQADAFMKEREDLTIDLDKEKLRCEMIRKDLKETEEKLEDILKQLEDTEKKLNDAINDIEILKQKEANFVKVQSDLETKLGENDDEIKKLQEIIAEMKLNYENKIVGLNDTIDTMKENYKELQEELSKVKNEAYSKEIELKKLEVEKCQISEEIGLLKSELQTLKNNANKLEDEISTITSNYNELKDDKESLEKESIAIKLELSDITTTVESLRNENQENQEKLDCANQEIVALKEEITEIEEELKEKGETIDSLQTELDSAKSSFQNKTTKDKQAVATLDTKVKTLKSELVLKSKNVKDLEKELKILKDKMAIQMKEQTKLEESLEKKNQLLREKDAELEKLTSQARENNRKLEETSLQAQTCFKEKEASKALFDSQMKDFLNLMEKSQMGFQSDIIAKENELQRYKKQLAEYQKIASQAELKDTDLKKFKKECDDLESENKHLKKGKKKLEDQLDELEDEIKGLKKNIADLNAKNLKQEDKLNQQAKTIKEQSQTIEDQRQTIKDQSQTIKEKSQIIQEQKNKMGSTNNAKPIKALEVNESVSNIDGPQNDQYYSSDSSPPAMDLEEFLKKRARLSINNSGANKRKLFELKPAETVTATATKPSVTEPRRKMVKMFPPKDTSSPKADQKRKFFVSNNKRLGDDSESDNSLL